MDPLRKRCSMVGDTLTCVTQINQTATPKIGLCISKHNSVDVLPEEPQIN